VTEIAKDREDSRRDMTTVDFFDIFHHRFFTLFYRAWASAQSAAGLDRPGEEQFSFYVASLTGQDVGECRQRPLPSHARLAAAPHLVRESRNPDGLRATLERYFGVPVAIEEHGLRFLVNLAEGQKTGFYLDQRDNRRAVARLAAGRRVLDAFCYTGGFALHAAHAGTTSVLGVDVSEPALALARANARLNGLTNLTFERANVFERLAALAQAGDQFGLVVLDPPKFARTRGAVEDALRGYRQLQKLALRLLGPDGILVMCCCSGLITQDTLDALLAQLAVEERREVQILEHRGQAADHPVAVTCPESNYLKCVVSRVH
jgi:23S rRNA G2069 N7-methylase RlmK/C1962 C5-methylase RlmI